MAFVGPVSVYTVTLASGVTTSSGVDLGGAYGKIAIGIPSMPSGGNTVFYGSDAIDGTYQPIYLVQNSAPNTPVQVSIVSAVSNALVNIFPITCQFLKVGVTTAATATPYTFKIYCSAN